MWELVSEGASVGRDASTRTSWGPRELTVVYLLASTIDMYLNHCLLTITQQRLFSETLQTALFCLAFSNLDVPLSPSSGKSRRSLLTGSLGSHGLVGPPLPATLRADCPG